MNLRFLPKGGFNKKGAFIEYEGDEPTGHEPEYERLGYLSLDIVCDQVEVRSVAEIVNEYVEVQDSDRTVIKLIVGEGTIQPARVGRFTLSFLGKKREHNKVSLSIHSSEVGEEVSFAGIYAEDDFDVVGQDEFYVQIHLHRIRFDALVSELAEDGATLKVHVEASAFENFYSTWSPTISDGREIKFLDRKLDVENAYDIPEDFWVEALTQKEMLSDKDRPPAQVAVVRLFKSLI